MNTTKQHEINALAISEARALLLDNDKILRRKVRSVSAAVKHNEYTTALYTLAAGHKFDWTPADWEAVLHKLDDCELTVGEWLDAPNG